ncbi:S-layer homology domain-containing protein [Fusibacter paucivorans]|uniref:S-layer homology domain-containing protein n=1 Tax=Fusibacter paucivorans TaxID=76009 RepID=A0ABS5PKP0_9FIRM|nr:BsuPI-related putative proteinase inhibitor [Fusibacter paucivorans]MBS7525427.1 S-layer homology domain-containing protein [Fusibacter paucivorans]
MKKMIKTFTAVGLMLVINTSMVFASVPFNDTAMTSYNDAIEALASQEIVGGVGHGLFQPDRQITNAEAIQMITKAFNINLSYMTFIKAPELSDFFDFASADAWYEDAFINAGANGLPIDRTIMPNESMTRENFYSILEAAMEMRNELPMINLIPTAIEDFESMDVLKSGAIHRALAYGILKLDEDGMFYPNAYLTRGEAAQAVYDAMNVEHKLEAAGNAMTGKLEVTEAEDGVTLTFTMKNDSDETALLTYHNGQRYDIYIYDSYGTLIYQWSNDKVFTMAIESVVVDPGKTIEYETVWPMTDNEGKRVLRGQYNVVFESAYDIVGNKATTTDSMFIIVP